MIKIEESSSSYKTKVALSKAHANVHSLVVEKGYRLIANTILFLAQLVIENSNYYGLFK